EGDSITFRAPGFSDYVITATRDGDGTEEFYTIHFRNRNGEEFETIEVPAGNAIGTLPEIPAREDYNPVKWAVGTYTPGEGNTQGTWSIDTNTEVTAETIPEADMDVLPVYEMITYTITFYAEDKTTEVATKTVNANSSYCLNDIPEVPEKAGNIGKWVYQKNEDEVANFNNKVAVSGDLSVWAAYDQNVFTVTYLVEGEEYLVDTYFDGDTLGLPVNPVVEGKTFTGWFAGETQYIGGEEIKSNLTLEAAFDNSICVRFVVIDGENETTVSKLYFQNEDDTVGVTPQAPFISGKIFEKWVIQGTETEVTADTPVGEGFVAVAVYNVITVYKITTEYYYLNDHGTEVIFNTDLLEAEYHDLPYTITAPATTQTSANEVAGAPIYYPETPTVTVAETDFDEDLECLVRIKYVPYTAEYDFVYKLKNLDGNGYTDIPDSRVHVQGVLNSTVTPIVKTFNYAVLESAEPVTITQVEGQELEVLYTRKNYSLSYNTNGGSYVAGGTYAYGSTVTISSDNPSREGYNFVGWYLDSALTQPASDSITINGDTVLYAKWDGKTVGYTIIYMKEVYDNATGTTSYVYENSNDDVSGKVGTTVYAASAPGIALNGYERDSDMNGTATAGGTGEDTAVEILPDGSTVLKVYYTLIRYTLVFNANNGEIAMNGTTYTGSEYQIENVVLGQSIGSQWPSSSNEVYRNNYHFNGWTGAPGSRYVTKQYELIWNHVQNANNDHVMTFSAYWVDSSYGRDAYYWLQQPDGSYKIEDAYTQIGLNTNNLTAKDIDGYTINGGDGRRPDGTNPATGSAYPNSGNTDVTEHVDAYVDTYTDNGGHNNANPNNNDRTITRTVDGISVTYTFDHSEGYWASATRYRYRYIYTGTVPAHDRTVQRYVYNFYYNRAKYDIIYHYNGSVIHTEADIYFEADISGATYNYTPARPAGMDSDYTWGGWYADNALQTPYTFTTMPGHDLPLYAKWTAPTFTVTFKDADDSSVVYNTVNVEKYSKVSAPESNPTKAGYTFDGWYISPSGEMLYDWNKQIVADTYIYAHWTQDILEYIVHYVTIGENDEVITIASDKVVSNPNFTVGQVITEQAIAVAGYRPLDSSKTLTLSSDSNVNVITFVYSEKTNETSYVVKYILDPSEYPGEIRVAADNVVEHVPGDTASVIEMAAAVDDAVLAEANLDLNGANLRPDAEEKTFVLTAVEEQNVFYFYYSGYKSATVTVNYVDMDGGAIADPSVQTVKVGQTFTLKQTPITGWELNRAVEGTYQSQNAASGSYTITETLADNGLTLTLVYQRKLTITARSASKQYDGDPLVLGENPYTAVGLQAGDSISNIEFTYTNADYDIDGVKGRLNAGIAVVMPHD
nr:InlB B-repeat-containing protein [Clostridia bacterium]